MQFDNTHLFQDRPGVPSDLEQMPNLLNFLTNNGTLSDNEHTILISHTAGGILSSLTGLYPDRNGITVSNSYRYFKPDGTTASSGAFKYWNDRVDDVNPDPASNDPLPNMVTTGGLITPAPWVPYTRAGCDYGAVSTANVVLENTGTGAFGDMTTVFGAGSTEWNEAKATPALAQTDFVGIAIHCAQGGGICGANATNVANSRPDPLLDELGGYSNYRALFGAKYVNPAICAVPGASCQTVGGLKAVNSTAGDPVTDPFGRPGFPGFDGALAKNTLGYLAQMQEAGIPITWGYISDAHDNHTSSFPAPFNPAFPRASGPGEADYKAQLKAYDDAFAAYFLRLKKDGIDQSNTLFMVTVDEGDKFAGGIGTPQTDGSLAYAHTNCSWTTTPACPTNQIGEVNMNMRTKLPTGTPGFQVHNDSAPTFYVNGQPERTNSVLRKMERDVGDLQAIDPYVSSSPTTVFERLADTVEEKTLHMVNSDPARTPSFTGFADPNWFLTGGTVANPNANPSCGSNPCVDYHFAWSHGDIQDVIGTTWVGFVGPGVASNGVDNSTWTDHTNVRPTMLSLLGLTDDYVHDGRVLIEALTTKATPQSLIAHRETVRRLSDIYEQVNAPFGQFAMDTLVASTRAIKSTDESVYNSIESSIENLTTERDALATQIKTALGAAAFAGQALNEQQAKAWIDQAQSLLDRAAALKAG
ncbi:MAG: alkaline phosphatase family protein [Actinobacteria bacterium]|nr:MAG: alkaline phosphatase family protein [Actinomycetota bacterium]